MRPVHESPSLLYLLGRTLTLSLTALGLTVGLGLALALFVSKAFVVQCRA